MKTEDAKTLTEQGTLLRIEEDEIGTYFIIKEILSEEGIPTRYVVSVYQKGNPGFEVQRFYETSQGELRRRSRPLLNWDALQTIRDEDIIQKAITILDYLS